MAVLDEVKQLLVNTLQLEAGVDELDLETPLLGSIPELDSMTVVSLITTLEEHYGFVVEDDEIGADIFATVGSLVEFVESKV